MNTRLRRIFRGEEIYGDGPPAEQARRYRLTELLQATVAQAKINSADVPRGPVDLLVSLSGFSPETTILAYELLQPQRLMIIGSDATQSSLDTIQGALKLPFSRIQTQSVVPTDPMKIYQLIQEAARSAGNGGRIRPNIIIDITGGKKVMSASAALAAAQLDMPMCYIDSNFDPELRQSLPGTERLVIIPNPTKMFGDRELDAALVAFRHGAFASAHARFAEVAESAYEPARARFLRDLASVYEAWCDLNFPEIGTRARIMRTRLSDPGHRVSAGAIRRLRHQLDFLDTLALAPTAGRQGATMLLNFYLLGQHYLRLGRNDFGALLYYRTVESCFAQRLASIGSGFQTGNPDYRLLSDDVEDLESRYRAASASVHGTPATGLPAPVALMDTALLLYVLGDPMIRRLDLTSDKGLRHLKDIIRVRNESVLAHGTKTIDPRLSKELGSLALRSVRAFWELEFGNESVDDRIATLKFLVDV
ncbi:TIGR02710 family CRISPR-associated CARF protein [Actinomycetes bacterium KLBMP 9797]